MQQSLAEYKFNQNTDFIFYRRVPGIASNILRNVSLQFTEIVNYLHLHLYTLHLQKTKQDFSRALRQNPPGHWVIFIFNGQKSCTRIIYLIKNKAYCIISYIFQGLKNCNNKSSVVTPKKISQGSPRKWMSNFTEL